MRYLTIIFFAALLINPLVYSKEIFEIPRGAWQRTIGDIPAECESNCPNRGIALGGFGAGSFMYNISGSFGPWADEVGEYSNTWLKEAAFHIYERKGEEKIVKCLSTDTVMMSAWSKLQMGEGTYYALQPEGWCVYHCFNSDISSEFFSPIIPHNYRETSYPVAVWQFKFFNPTAESVEVSVMFTWPNPPFNGGRQTRTGFTNNLVTTSDVLGMVLKANYPSNTPETQNSEWCIATKTVARLTVTYASWNRGGDGDDIWNQFYDDGILSDSINSLDSAAAIAVKTVLSPGASIVIPIVLSWDFPVVEFRSNLGGGQVTQWWKKYCEYFDTLSDNSFDIAVEALQNYPNWENQVHAWMSPFIDDPRYPDWLLCAAFNELYYNQFGGSFWESGLKSGHPEEFMGLHPEDHKNFIMESQVYTLSGNINVGHYSSIDYARFWPEMERDLLRCHADIILYYDRCNPTLPNQTCPEIGAPRDASFIDTCRIGDPFFLTSPHLYLNRAAPCAPGSFHTCSDNSSKFIQQVWRYYYLYHDMGFLEYVWPAVESTYSFMKSYDCEAPPKDSLPYVRGYDNAYDGWKMVGTDMYSGGFWVGALEAMDTMAAILNKPIKSEVQAWLQAARRNLDAKLWDTVGLYYRIDTESAYPTAVFSDALCGQRYCEEYGLPDILPRWKMTWHLQKVYEINVSPNLNFGAKLGRLPDGSTVPSGDPYTFEYWVGTTYYVAAMMYHSGLNTEAWNTAYGAYYPVYVADHLAYWFNTPEAWRDEGYDPRPGSPSAWVSDRRFYESNPPQNEKGDAGHPFNYPHQYQRPRAVWELMFEIQNDTTSYRRGDANGDGAIDLGDMVFLITYLYRGGVPPQPLEAGDVNCDGTVNLGDIVYLINYLYRGGSPPCEP
jgi:non-lysosomal glucosylceramidase